MAAAGGNQPTSTAADDCVDDDPAARGATADPAALSGLRQLGGAALERQRHRVRATTLADTVTSPGWQRMGNNID